MTGGSRTLNITPIRLSGFASLREISVTQGGRAEEER
jgi:hypothetical protein